MGEEESSVFTYVSYIIISSALVLNSIGTYLLFKIDLRASKQTLLLINLSVIKVIISLSELVLTVIESHDIDSEHKAYQMIDVFNAGLYGINDLIILVITLDRLLATLYTIHYHFKVTRNRLIAAVVLSWAVGTIGILPFFFIEYDLLYTVFYKIVFLTLDALVLTISIFTYIYILKRLVDRKKTIHMPRQEISFFKQHGRFFFISALIIASFILFVAIPDIVYVIMVVVNENYDPMIENSVGLVWNMYLITDPFIYIFLQRPVRRRITRLFTGNRVEVFTECTRPSRYKGTDRDWNKEIVNNNEDSIEKQL